VLRERGFQSTKLASTGGFLREGNTTVLIGVEDHKVEDVKAILHATCRERTKVVTAGSPIHALEGVFASQPMEGPVGGSSVFVINAEEFVRLCRRRGGVRRPAVRRGRAPAPRLPARPRPRRPSPPRGSPAPPGWPWA